MKTCKEGCGGKMKDGGKVTAIKKMMSGGVSKGCPPGQYWSVQGCQDKTNKYKPPFSSAGAKAGIITGLTGIGAGIGKMASDFSKKRKAVSAIKKSNPGMTRKEARNKLNEPVEEKTLGGTKKKYQKGGGIQQIVGMPGYNATTRPITMKKGGVTKNAKLAALAAPKNKITRADIITGAKRNAKKK
jgi:hypothetical protein